MQVIINVSSSAMRIPVGGQEFTLLPRKHAHVSQIQSVYAIVCDAATADAPLKDWIDRNKRRRYVQIGTAIDLEKLRPSQIVVIRDSNGAVLEPGAGRAAELTLEGIKARIPELFPGGAMPERPVEQTPESLGLQTREVPKRTVYVSRDGGAFATPWAQIKPGDTFMIREATGEYVKDPTTGETEFVASGSARMVDGVWTIPSVPLSKHEVDQGGVAVDNAKAGQTHEPNADDATGDDDGSDADTDAEDEDDGDDSDAEDDSGDEDAEGKTLADTKMPPVGRKSTKGQGRPGASKNKGKSTAKK